MDYRCDICDKKFTKKRNLKRHVTEKHEKKSSWKCTVDNCEKTFSRRSNLISHLMMRHKLSPNEATELTIKSTKRDSGVSNNDNHYSDVSDDDSVLDIVNELDEFTSHFDYGENHDMNIETLITVDSIFKN